MCGSSGYLSMDPRKQFISLSQPPPCNRTICLQYFFRHGNLQNLFKSTIRERIRKCAPRRRVAPHAAELGSISQQFASPDTKGAFTHYTAPVDGTRTRITHCSSRGLLQLLFYRWIPRYDRSMQRASTQPTFLITPGGL